MAKTKKPDFAPNPYEGFRATTRESDGRIEVYMSLTGNQGSVKDALIATFDADITGRGRADMAFLFVQTLAVLLNAGISIREIGWLWDGVESLGDKYQIEIPKGWTILTVAGLNLQNHQLIYVHEASGRVAIVDPDVQTTLATLEDIVFEGGHSVATPGRRTEIAKIQHQPHSGEKKVD